MFLEIAILKFRIKLDFLFGMISLMHNLLIFINLLKKEQKKKEKKAKFLLK